MSIKKIKRALISLYDKNHIEKLARYLNDNGVEIIATGTTAEVIRNLNIKVIEVSEYTKFPEILGGRVKTLHPLIHGGLLYTETDESQSELSKHGILKFDLIIVNLYDFTNNKQKDNAMEYIDIGGVTLLRAAAKNYKNISVLCNPNDYANFKLEENTAKQRMLYAQKAFNYTSKYEQEISQWFDNEINDNDNDNSSFDILSDAINNINDKNHSIEKFRYGENPHQMAIFKGNKFWQQLCGKEISYNNILDVDAAYKIIKEINNISTNNIVALILKHNNPCGVAALDRNIKDNNLYLAYQKALECDGISAFGGIVAFNEDFIDEKLAHQITKIFTEIVIAPYFSQEVINILTKKSKNIRLLQVDYQALSMNYEIRKIYNGLLIQEYDNKLFNIDESNNHQLKCVTKKQCDLKTYNDLLIGFAIVKHVKSNAIVAVANGITIGIGAGQMNRVASMKLALQHSKNQSNIIIASDAFFPFEDSIESASENGVIAIIQPGGSIKDEDVIKKADELGITMLFTGIRHFKH